MRPCVRSGRCVKSSRCTLGRVRTRRRGGPAARTAARKSRKLIGLNLNPPCHLIGLALDLTGDLIDLTLDAARDIVRQVVPVARLRGRETRHGDEDEGH